MPDQPTTLDRRESDRRLSAIEDRLDELYQLVSEISRMGVDLDYMKVSIKDMKDELARIKDHEIGIADKLSTVTRTAVEIEKLDKSVNRIWEEIRKRGELIGAWTHRLEQLERDAQASSDRFWKVLIPLLVSGIAAIVASQVGFK